MFTTIAALILLVLIFIARDLSALGDRVGEISKTLLCRRCHGSGHAPDAIDSEERCETCCGDGSSIGEMNKWLGRLNGIHDTILKQWACPTCLGSGRVLFSEPEEVCETCLGTGMRKTSADPK